MASSRQEKTPPFFATAYLSQTNPFGLHCRMWAVDCASWQAYKVRHRALRMSMGQNSLKILSVWACQGQMTCESMVRCQKVAEALLEQEGNRMANGTYDIITVGGGMGGSAFAFAMADHGARVLVLEREQHFRDRVRGEGMHAWGVPEARALGIYERLRETCGVEVRWWDTYLRTDRIDHRDFPATTPHHSP